jgi:hypothetical protein
LKIEDFLCKEFFVQGTGKEEKEAKTGHAGKKPGTCLRDIRITTESYQNQNRTANRAATG